MGHLVRGRDGAYQCTGHYCGYPLAWHPPCPEEDEPSLWVCLDCGAAVYGEREPPREAA